MDFGLNSYRPEKQELTSKRQNIFLLISLPEKHGAYTLILCLSVLPY